MVSARIQSRQRRQRRQPDTSSDEDGPSLMTAPSSPPKRRHSSTSTLSQSLVGRRGARSRKTEPATAHESKIHDFETTPHRPVQSVKVNYGKGGRRNSGRLGECDEARLDASKPSHLRTSASSVTRTPTKSRIKSSDTSRNQDSMTDGDDSGLSTPSRTARRSARQVTTSAAAAQALYTPQTTSKRSKNAITDTPSKRIKRSSNDSVLIETPSKRTRAKPVNDDESEESDPENIAQDLVQDKPRQLATPRSTPTKPSHADKLLPTRPIRHARATSVETAEETDAQEREGNEEEDEEEDEQTQRSSTPSPSKNQTLAETTPRRSARARRLPVAKLDIDAAPKELRNRLVGWHMNDGDEDSSADELDVLSSPSRSGKSSTAATEMIRDSLDHSQLYPARNLSFLFSRILNGLNGWTLPRQPRAPAQFDRRDALAYPHLSGGYSQWEKPLRYAMNGVVQHNVGNCLIMLGPRGVGKTMVSAFTNMLGHQAPRGMTDFLGRRLHQLFERTVQVLEKAYGKDAMIIVRLSGLVHTTDRLALRSIAHQLQSQGLSDEDGDFGSNAATMTTLLHMLEPANDPRSVAEKPIIILVDEFDLFAQHPRQSFLYSLLDIVQGNRRKAGMGVVGLSARSDCLSILEKRVRSRCQSQVHQMVLQSDFDSYTELAKQVLSVDATAFHEFGDEHCLGPMADDWNLEVEVSTRWQPPSTSVKTTDSEIVSIKAFLDDPLVFDHLERVWSIHGNTPAPLLQALAPVLTHCENLVKDDDQMLGLPHLSHCMFIAGAKPTFREDLPLDHLTILDLTVCVAAKHMRAQHENAINVELLYRCYLEHVQRSRLMVSAKAWTRLAFCMSFDRLRALEILLPWTGKTTQRPSPSRGDRFKLYRFVPWDSTLDEAVRIRQERSRDVPEPLRKWLKSQDA
ncbi:BZ3500_MvSof-1268-A1-R1_Chr7-1g09327 [Microbotryum saponariae]|uniref:BZ3500_MvSof-1268-A1-R1_Chr7-1g09327 protein n=1 Tax=Microbotryum saponariae TaxID=289078 RepID=A0A2X0LEC2_9BASI|nr:BZ3501_MvSof-1269-A2-R1_Chr7-1g09032 [Microbotryum saponariae]SDA03238.1 BZ3500_MvSof-1268-A1-R1_Chr7-1g09327 [Microbotryum saponariae]